MPVTRALVHHAAGGFDDSPRLDQIGDLVQDASNVLWLDIQDPTGGDLALLRHEFGVHDLALEDVVRGHQRPKIEHYGSYFFIVFYAMRADRCVEIDLVVGQNYLVTVHVGDVPEIAETADRWRRNADRVGRGAFAPVYSLFDALVDGYFPVIDGFAEQTEAIEQALFDAQQSTHLREIFALKRQLLEFRRILAPEREVLNVLIRRDEPILGEETRVYFQDVYDHVIRVLDSIDLYRDQFSGLLDAYLAVVSNRLNFTMKRMTALATILLSITVISGIYGMNFRNMPELTWEYGYFLALGVIVIVGLSLTITFRRIDWL